MIVEELFSAIDAFCEEHGDAILAALLGYRTSNVLTNWRRRRAIPLKERARIRQVMTAKTLVLTIEKGKPPTVKHS